MSHSSRAAEYVTNHYRTANLGWLKDNEGNYFIAVDTHIQRVATVQVTPKAKGKPDTDGFPMLIFNNKRSHQGKMGNGRTPVETLIDGKWGWAEKNLTRI